MNNDQTPPDDASTKAEQPVWPPKPEAVGAFTSGTWRAMTVGEKDSEEAKAVAASTDAALREELGLIVNAETLIVLAGSGTSLGLLQADGTKKAPSMGALWSDVSDLPEFEAVKRKLNPDLVGAEKPNLEHVLSDAQARQALTPDDAELASFVAAAEEKVLERCSFVDDETDVNAHEIFLRKVARRSTRLQRTQLFTTNYDLAFETAARRARFNVIDGSATGATSSTAAHSISTTSADVRTSSSP